MAAALPLLLFSAVLLQRAYSASVSLIEDAALGNVRRMALAVDAQVGRAQAVAVALAESYTLDAADLAEFEDAATRAMAANGLRGAASLARPDGSKAAHTLSTPGQTLPPISDQAGLQRLFDTGQPQVSGLYVGQITHEPQIALHVPVRRGGQVLYDVVMAISASSIDDTLRAQPLPPGWFSAVADREGKTIARTRGSSTVVGAPISKALAAAAARRPEDFGPVVTREGDTVYAAYLHSPLTGWLVSVAVPEAELLAPRLRSTGALAAGGVLLVLASAGLAWLMGRNIARPVHALAEQAARLGRNELPDPAATLGVGEAETAGRALQQAGMMLAARDKERAAALRRAEESEARLLLAQEAGEIGAWETDAVTGRRTWSLQQFRLYGVDPASEPPHGPAWAMLIHPEDRARVLDLVGRAYQEPMSYQHEFRIISPERPLRWIRSAGRSLFHNGRPVRLIGVTLDTTDRHEAERALREGAALLEAEVASRTRELAESEGRFRTYFEYSADALLVLRVEPAGRFVIETMNQAAERLTGYSLAEVAGKSPQDVLLPETAAVLEASYRQVAETNAPLRVEQMLALPAGTIEVESVLVPVRDPVTSRIVRIIAGQRDLTERRQLDAKLAHSQRLEAVGQLTGGVAHDFNNLLTVVIGNLSLLGKHLSHDEKAARYLRSVEQAAQRGAKLTASLLAFSRRQTLHVAPLDVGALLQESTVLIHRALGEEIELLLEIAPGLPLATADAAQLEAAVLNLAINARDAMMQAMDGGERRSGTLQITVRAAVLRDADLEDNDEARAGRFVAIQISDTGTGMTPEVRARAFEPFFTTKDVGQGTGLGLSQVFGFVRQLGGHMTLTSTPGHGTSATLYLPAAEVDARASADSAVPTESVPAGAVVLVVEDDAGIRDVTAEMLREAGLSVLTAADGPKALELLRGSGRVDALFSDVVMPGGATGVDLARAARALRPGLPVLLTSGYGGPALSRYGADGEYEVLAKPYTRAALMERLGKVLAGEQ